MWFAGGKRRGTSVSLLIEPSLEVEQMAIERRGSEKNRCFNHHHHEKSDMGYNKIESLSSRDKKESNFVISEEGELNDHCGELCPKEENIKMGIKSSWWCNERGAMRRKQHEKRRKELTSLLTILFGALILMSSHWALFIIQSVHCSSSSPTSSPQTSNTQAASSLVAAAASSSSSSLFNTFTKPIVLDEMKQQVGGNRTSFSTQRNASTSAPLSSLSSASKGEASLLKLTPTGSTAKPTPTSELKRTLVQVEKDEPANKKKETSGTAAAAAQEGRSNNTASIHSPALPAQPVENELRVPPSAISNKEAEEEEEGGSVLTPTVIPVAVPNEPEESATEVVRDEDVENDNNNNSDESANNKLSAFLVGTASEAADQLVGRIRGTGENLQVGSEEDVDVDTSENVDSHEPIDSTNHTTASKRKAKLIHDNSTTPIKSAESLIQDDEEQLRVAMETYAKWRAAGDDIIELFSRKVLPVIIENGYELDDTQTMTGLLQVFNGIRGLKPWAMKLIDASAKISPGILIGTQSDFGDFDECLNVRVDDPSGLAANIEEESMDERTGLKSSTVVGQYCLADIEFPKPPRKRLDERNEELQTDFAPIELRRPLLNFSDTPAYKDTIFVETGNFFHMLYVDPLRVGICLTNKINPESFAKVLNKITADFKVSINFHGRCVTKYDRATWSTQQKVSAYLLSIACSLVALCTVLDLLHAKLNKLPLPKNLDSWKINMHSSLFKYRPLFTSFSIIRNTKRLFKPQQAKPAAIQKQKQQLNQKNHHPQLINNMSPSSSDSSASSSESSPSIERRSSVTSSALNLISEPTVTLPTSRGLINKTDYPQQHHHSQLQKSDKNEINLLCLHGIRVITMIWMIVNHTYLFGGFFVLWAHRRLIDIAKWPESLSFQLVLNGWLTVETYFFLSATIIVLNVMPLIKSRKFAYFSFIFHRLIRLLPAYGGLVCLNFLWPLISSGPVWLVKGKSFIQTPCENYLWTNFLFINNWIWPEKQCMVHTWFLSADFQLYLLAPVIVYLLCRRPVLGHSLNIIVALVASIFSGFVIYANKLMPTTLINKLEFDSIKQQLSYSYFATYQHMGPYCLGIFIGYLLHNRPQVRLPKHLTWSLWLLLPPLSFTTLLLTYLWNGAYPEPSLINPSPLVSAFYVAIHRTIWTSLLAWIVFASATHRAKLMSSFLSHSFFIPLSRLSFSIYLVHLPIIMFRALNLRHTIEWTDSNILWEACGNFIASIIVAYFLNVAFESPFINLESVIFGRGSGSQPHYLKENMRINHLVVQTDSSKPKARGSLQPQMCRSTKESLESINGDLNDVGKIDLEGSEDGELSLNKSSSSHSQQLDSSQEQDLKLFDTSLIGGATDSLATTTTTAAVMAGPSSTRKGVVSRGSSKNWSDYHGSLKVRPLRQPKQVDSIEKLFIRQMEPQAPFENSPSDEQSVNLRDSFSTLQREPPMHLSNLNAIRQERTRRYSTSYDPETNSTQLPSNISDSLYPISSEYQHYARAGFQQRLTNRFVTRPSQYATLARTSRFDHDSSSSSMILNRFDNRYPRQTIYNFTKPIGRPTSSLGQYEVSAHLERQRAQIFQQQQQQQQKHLHNRRQGRYNTLNDTGLIQEWRQQQLELRHSQEDGENERENTHRPSLLTNSSGAPLTPTSEASNQWESDWLQPGALIPRVDSSTLRRQPKRAAEGGAQSIVEESAFEEEERNDAAL